MSSLVTHAHVNRELEYSVHRIRNIGHLKVEHCISILKKTSKCDIISPMTDQQTSGLEKSCVIIVSVMKLYSGANLVLMLYREAVLLSFIVGFMFIEKANVVFIFCHLPYHLAIKPIFTIFTFSTIKTKKNNIQKMKPVFNNNLCEKWISDGPGLGKSLEH